MPKNEKLLQEIRDRYKRCVNAWQDIRDEGAKDMRYIAGDSWEPEERKRREAAGRPCLTLDELSQYANQAINDVRQQKRAIRVIPAGDGADEKTAEFRAALIRQIEYKSNAQQAYCSAFEGAIQRSYGFFRVGKRYVGEDTFDQELTIRRIANPDTVLLDPDHREADGSDARYAFVLELVPKADFEARWPDADLRSFTSDHQREFPEWIREDSILVVEYWRVEHTTDRLLLLQDGSPEGRKVYLSEIPGAKVVGSDLRVEGEEPIRIVNQRPVQIPRVRQYIANGVEILETNDWEGKWIPIIPVYGKEIWVDQGGGSKRLLISLVRLARDSQQLYNYYRTCQAELVGQTPKNPFVGAEGQFENHEDEWSTAHTVPRGYLEYKVVTDHTGSTPLPPPQRQNWEPPIQMLEMGAEGARRAIQAALGMYNASVGKQDSNARSGVAIKALDLQSNQGSFHFVDNFDRALQHCGRILDGMLDTVYDTPREVGLMEPDDKQRVVKINDPAWVNPRTKQTEELRTDRGRHDVTISTGPSFQSQREEASDFADTLAQNPQIFARVADLVISLKNLGPIGDQIAERLRPPDVAKDGEQQIPPQAQQALQQLQQQLQAINAYAQGLEAKLQEATSAAALKRMELDSRERIAALQAQLELVKTEAQLQSKEGIILLQEQLAQIRQQITDLAAPEPAPEAAPPAEAPAEPEAQIPSA